jgi:hypothetical protein
VGLAAIDHGIDPSYTKHRFLAFAIPATGALGGLWVLRGVTPRASRGQTKVLVFLTCSRTPRSSIQVCCPRNSPNGLPVTPERTRSERVVGQPRPASRRIMLTALDPGLLGHPISVRLGVPHDAVAAQGRRSQYVMAILHTVAWGGNRCQLTFSLGGKQSAEFRGYLTQLPRSYPWCVDQPWPASRPCSV